MSAAGLAGALTGPASGFWATGSAVGAPSARGVGAAAGADAVGGVAGAEAGAGGAPLAGGAAGVEPPLLAPESAGLKSWKKSHQAASTLFLSARYCW